MGEEERDWFGEWSRHHAAVFGLTADVDGAMIAAWRTVFDYAGFSDAELREATNWMATNRPPQYRSQHLPAIIARVNDRRHRARQKNEETYQRGDDIGICASCNGSGFAIVPHPKHIVDGEWVYPFYTAAMVCRCGRGHRLLPIGETNKPKPATLDWYELRWPHWRDMVRWRDKQKQAETSARHAANQADQHGKLTRNDPSKKALERLVGSGGK